MAHETGSIPPHYTPDPPSPNPAESNQSLDQLYAGIFPKGSITKIHHAERDQLAQEVWQVRTSRNLIQQRIDYDTQQIEQFEQQLSQARSLDRSQTAQLQARASQISYKLKQLVGLTDSTYEQLEQNQLDLISETDAITKELESVTSNLANQLEALQAIDQPEHLIATFKESKLNESLTVQEKRDLLKPEYLAQLSTEEYIALWKKLNPNYLAHVTRNGVRDVGKDSLNATGYGIYNHGITGLNEDKQLLSRLQLWNGLMTRNPPQINAYLESSGIFEHPDAQSALNALKTKLLKGSGMTTCAYTDAAAIHFAGNKVLDTLYGGESDNHVFYVYPTDVLASQYAVYNNGYEGFGQQPNDGYNDYFVMPKGIDNPGIPVDSGIAFLPSSTPVNPQTGSKYSITMETNDPEIHTPSINEELKQRTIEFIQNPDNMATVMDHISPFVNALVKDMHRSAVDLQYLNNQKAASSKALVSTLISIGFTDYIALRLANTLLSKVQPFANTVDATNISHIFTSTVSEDSSFFWQTSPDTIPARQYWEYYFNQNPHKRPAHIVYYDGDPTTAVENFMKQHNISKQPPVSDGGNYLGFADNVIDLDETFTDPRALPGYAETVEIATQILEEHYSQKPPATTPIIQPIL